MPIASDTPAPSPTSVPRPTSTSYVIPKALPRTGEGGSTGLPAWYVLAAAILLAQLVRLPPAEPG